MILEHFLYCEKWIDQQDTSVGRSPRQESNPWPPKHWVGTPFTKQRELMESKVI